MEDFRLSRSLVRFGSFELDPEAGELRRDGCKVRLQEQPLQILQILLQQPGKVIPREELRQKVWPSDTFVDFNHGINNAIKRLREALGDTAETPTYVETVPRRGYRFIGSAESPKKEAAARTRSLAVLPLENLSNDPEQEYFAEGLTEALITTLAKIRRLRVVSRTSCMQYKRVRRSLREIARELEVDTVVEGTVLRAGNRVRVTAQLIDAPKESHLWAESYERDIRDVLTLQSELAQAIAKEIRVNITPEERTHLATARTVDPEAYEAYLKGRYHWNRRSGEGLERAAGYFRQAVARDANYASAYAGLADCANIAGWWCFVSPEEGCGMAKALAQKALSIDNSLSEAHCSLAWSLLFYDFDFLNAEREFRLALSLHPENTTAVEWHAVFLGIVGRFDQSIAEILGAVRLDPLSAIIVTVAGMLFFIARRYDESIEMLQKALELDHNFSPARVMLAETWGLTGKHDLAIAEMEELVRITNRLPLHLFLLAHSYASAGKRKEAQRILQDLRDMSTQRYVPAYFLAIIYADLNEKDEAFRYLETAYREREAWVVFARYYPLADPLRSDPRFDDFLRRMNFP